VILTFNKAILLAQKKLSVLPDDLELVLSLASYNAWIGEHKLSEEYLNVIGSSSQLTVQHFFQIAVSYEVLKKSDQALFWIDKALKSGYPKELLLQSPELTTLKSRPMFKDILARY